MFRRALFVMTLSLLATATPPVTHAQAPGKTAALSWHCVQESDEHFHVLCIPRGEADAGTRDAPDETAAPLRPGAADMRPVAQRGTAEVFSAEAWRVPLHSAPTDPAHVATLLQSVLCGKHPACSVRYGAAGLRVARR